MSMHLRHRRLEPDPGKQGVENLGLSLVTGGGGPATQDRLHKAYFLKYSRALSTPLRALAA